MSEEGYIYILTNEYVPTLVKIGYTNRDPLTRANELSSTTGVPGKWVIVKYWYVQDPEAWERKLFSELSSFRETGEFFNLDSSLAEKLVFDILHNNKAVDEHGISPIERIREARNEKRRLSKEERNEKEAARQRKLDEEWELGWHKFIKPWCDHRKLCKQILSTYKPPSLLRSYLFGSTNELARMKKWDGYQKLKSELLTALMLSRVAREFRIKVLRSNSSFKNGRPIVGSLSNWESNWPCCNKNSSKFEYELFFINTYRAEPPYHRTEPNENDVHLEVRLIVQNIFGFSGEVADEFLRSEPEAKIELLNFVKRNLAPEFYIGYVVN